MTQHIKFALLVGFLIALTGCTGGGIQNGILSASTGNVAAPIPDNSGEIATSIPPNTAVTISASNLQGSNPLSSLTTVDFPAGALSQQSDIKLFETSSIAKDIQPADLGVTQITAIGPAIFLKGDDSALAGNITINLAYPDSSATSLFLANPDYVVLGIYLVNGATSAEIFSQDSLSFSSLNKTIGVKTKHFGAYQIIQLVGTVQFPVITTTNVSLDSLKPVVAPKKSCGSTPDKGTATRTQYQPTPVPYGQTCKPEDQTALCSNGTLGTWTGTYGYSSCVVEAAAKCDGGVESGKQGAKIRYQAATVGYGETCQSETQTATCTNGVYGNWSGTFTFDTCAVGAAADCGAVKNGQQATRVKYQANTVGYGQTCASETQASICSNGVMGAFSGTYISDSCVVNAAASCGSVLSGHLATRTKYQAATVASGQSCASESQTATCNNGTLGSWGGSFTFDSCSVSGAGNCGSTANGQQASRTKYQAASVAYGSTCSSESQTATCSNGTLGSWSGTFTNDSCTVASPASCGNVTSGQQATRTKYQTATVAYGQSCSSEVQSATCNNGTLGSWGGTFTNDSCTVNAPANCGSTPSGQQASRAMYQASSVAYGQSCLSESQSATCTNGSLGSWSGSYTFASCSVSAPASCGDVSSGQQATRTKYQTATVAYGQSCASESQTATCTNGSLGSWSGSYTYDSCSVNAPASCGST